MKAFFAFLLTLFLIVSVAIQQDIDTMEAVEPFILMDVEDTRGMQSIDEELQRPMRPSEPNQPSGPSTPSVPNSPTQPEQQSPFQGPGRMDQGDDNEFSENFGNRGRFRFCRFCPYIRFCPIRCGFGSRCSWTRRTCYSCPSPYCRPIFFPGRGRPFEAQAAQ